MNDHLPAGPGRAGALGLDPGAARGQGPGRADRVEAARVRSPLGAGRDTGRRAEGTRGRRHRVPVVRPRRGRHACPAGDKTTGRRGLNRRGQQSRGGDMTKPKIDAPILDQAPTADKLTDYDRLHLITYIRLLDADADGMPWEEASHSILQIDPETEPERARRAHRTHLARAQWMTRVGYRHILTDEKLRKTGDS